MRKWEYSYVDASISPYEWDEAREFGYIYAPDEKTARCLAWDKLGYEYTLCGIREVYE